MNRVEHKITKLYGSTQTRRTYGIGVRQNSLKFSGHGYKMRTIFVLLLLCVLFCYCEVNNSKKSQPWERCLAPTHKDGPQCKAYIIRTKICPHRLPGGDSSNFNE
ncbi:hypothetical protein NECAME_15296 [Necator americanus]|uniref:Uncharacterized protein n=1 Tax=Necator americanus TaxID=51031 RepID=W2SKS1_NECAM|nr:hypothetical protein NECAME_15296 [Necator americanus]ETN69461.1 hypothetical protein NECAME_15296 [Necator americanus]